MLKRLCLFFIASVLVVSGIAGCAEPVPPASKENKPISIGLILPLKGELEQYGTLCKNAIDMSVDAINTSGGVLGKQVEAIPGDDASSGQKQVPESIAQNFSGLQKVSAIVGPYTTISASAAAPVSQRNSTPMMAIRASDEGLTSAGDFIFRGCYVDTYQGTLLGKFATQELKAKKAAILYNKSDTRAQQLIQNFKTAIEKGDGKVVSIQSYDPQTKNMKPYVEELAELKPDVLLIPDYEDKAALIVKECDKQGVETKYLGTDLWNLAKFQQLAGKLSIGAYLTSHFATDDPDPAVQEFVEMYEGDYGYKPGISAALAYDSFNLVIDAIKRANSEDPILIRNALKNTNKYKGVTGTYTFDKNRNPIKGGAIIKVIDGGQEFVKRIEP